MKVGAGALEQRDSATLMAKGAPWRLYRPRQRRALLAVLFVVSTSNYLDRNVVSVLLEPINSLVSFPQLLLARVGVGAGEAGAISPAQLS